MKKPELNVSRVEILMRGVEEMEIFEMTGNEDNLSVEGVILHCEVEFAPPL